MGLPRMPPSARAAGAEEEPMSTRRTRWHISPRLANLLQPMMKWKAEQDQHMRALAAELQEARRSEGSEQ